MTGVRLASAQHPGGVLLLRAGHSRSVQSVPRVEGVIDLTAGEVTDGKAAVRGTFSGTLESIEGGGRIQVTNGRFEAREIPPVESLGDGR